MRSLAAAALLLPLAACAKGPPALDLASAGDRIVEARVAGRDRAWLLSHMDKSVRLEDAGMRAIPAGAPSRIVFDLTLPREATLHFSCGVDDKVAGVAGVEFLVKLQVAGREQVLHRSRLDPTRNKEHRGFVPQSVDLAAHSGKPVRLSFETLSPASVPDPRAAVWGNPVISGKDGGEPLVVVYLVDTLRADHTSVYGYSRDTTPRLAQFARDAVVFETAVSQAPWTRPSVASLMTSLLPSEHGAVFLRDRLDAKLQTLAEMLDARGFATAASVSNNVVSAPRTGFEQGFHALFDRKPIAKNTVDAALSLLETLRGRPTFLYVHAMDPHMPYTAPEPWFSRYDPKPTPGVDGKLLRHDPDRVANLAAYVARYDGEIAYGDSEFGRFVDALRERGLYDRALIVFLSDHGEEFLDHGDWGHGLTLFEELVRIPLLVKFPKNRHAGRRVAQLVQEVDVLPSVLSELGIAAPGGIVGRALQGPLTGTSTERPALLETSHRGNVIHGVRGPRDKYLRRFSPHDDELYFDLSSDPTEKQDRAAAAPERVRALRAGIGPTLQANPFRNVVRCVGPGAWDLEISAFGWIEDMESASLAASESATLSANRDRISLRCRPAAGATREISFVARPRGTRVTIAGSRNGVPLRPGDVLLGGEARPAKEAPAIVPNIDEAQDYKPYEPKGARRPGIYAWIVARPGREAQELGPEAMEQLRALGYIQ